MKRDLKDIKPKDITLGKVLLYMNYKINGALHSFRRLIIPFPERFVSNTTDMINKVSSDTDERIYRGPMDFPEIEELKLYWGIYKNITRTLRKGNRFDLYYNWKDIHKIIKKEDRVIIKDLFEMWYVQHFQPKRILEVGTRTGKSLISQMIFHYEIDNTLVFCIDPFVEQGSSRKILKNLKLIGSRPLGLVVLNRYSEEIMPEIKRVWPELYFDFILVDGSHEPEDAYRDLQMSVELLDKGGILCFDDLGPTGYNLITVWEKWKEEHGSRFTTREYYKPYGFGVAQKIR